MAARSRQETEANVQQALRSSSPPFLLFPPLPPPGTFDLVQRVAMSTTAFMLPRFFAHETPLFSVSLVRFSLSAIVTNIIIMPRKILEGMGGEFENKRRGNTPRWPCIDRPSTLVPLQHKEEETRTHTWSTVTKSVPIGTSVLQGLSRSRWELLQYAFKL